MYPVDERANADDDRCVVLIQQGARRNYVYARQLESAGLLHALVTDAAWSERAPSIVTSIAARLAPRMKGAVTRRTVRGVAPKRVRRSFAPALALLAKPFVHPERAFTLGDELLAAHCSFSDLRQFDGVGVIVNYHGNGGSFLDRAKEKGVKIVTDFVITPKYLEIEQAERDRWPGWEVRSTSAHVIAAYRRKMAQLVALSDIYLCPSPTVARDLADLPGFDPVRVRLVPYGVSGVLLREAMPTPGRVLFAGAVGLRKGLPYLAEAARALKARRPEMQFVVAGHVSDAIRCRPETRDLTFLGALDRETMADEFARADVYCLPSLAEGSATSIFEAMANGLPTVTTSSSGSFVVDDVEGAIVPERDGSAIADALERIVADRGLRARMSEAARATSKVYDDEACGRLFIDVIRSVVALSLSSIG